MRDEPETSGGYMLRVNEIHYGELGAADAGRDAGVCGGQSGSTVPTGRTGGGLRFCRARAEGPAVPAAQQRPAGSDPSFSGQGDGPKPRATHAPDPTLAAYAQGHGAT